MLINVATKTLPVFNKLQKSAGKDYDRAYTKENPLFTWYARHITIQYKKVVVLMNEQTQLMVLVPDVNAKNKKELDTLIALGIAGALMQLGTPKYKVEQYLKEAGDIEIGAAINRSISSRITNYLMIIREAQIPVELDNFVQPEVVPYFAKMPFKIGTRVTSANDEIDVAFKQPFKVAPVQVEEEAGQANHLLERTWRPFKRWAHDPEDGLLEESVLNEMEANNEVCLQAFHRYLLDGEGLSEKVAKRHTDYTRAIINGIYLLWERTPTLDYGDLFNYFSEPKYMDSETQLKYSRAAARKFYHFLYLTGEITKEDEWEAKENIKTGAALAEDVLDGSMDWLF